MRMCRGGNFMGRSATACGSCVDFFPVSKTGREGPSMDQKQKTEGVLWAGLGKMRASVSKLQLYFYIAKDSDAISRPFFCTDLSRWIYRIVESFATMVKIQVINLGFIQQKAKLMEQ
ncbi:hypothetical protein GOBAR_DD26278 [Gossypium barbadense]|nr:hypothetical protein GOBAR_DD26278 [Gossypium barbadense]